MSRRFFWGAFSAGKSLLASRAEVLLVDASLQVQGSWRPADGDAVRAIALSENGAHAAIATEADRVVVWSTQTLTERVLLDEPTMPPMEKLMAALLGEEIAAPALLLAASNDGERVAVVRSVLGGTFTLEMVGHSRPKVNVEGIEYWMRMSINDDVVVLGRSTYAGEDLTQLTVGEEVIARSGDAELLRTRDGEIALRVANATTPLGAWDDAGFSSDEVVLVRLRQDRERGPRFLDVQRVPLGSTTLETRSIPWDAPDASDPYGERDALCDCANLRGVVHAAGVDAWVDLRTGARIGDVELAP